jgi:myosin protein heavy chain
MDDVKESLDRVKHDNHKLEAELRGMQSEPRKGSLTHERTATATVEQKARNLQAKVTENSGAIDRLRQERSMLLNDHKQLQQQYSDVNEVSPMGVPKRILSP